MASPADAGPGKKGHAHSHDAKKEAHGHGNHTAPGGKPGDPKNVSRTILIIAEDNEFNLKKIQVKDGETIRFVVRNKGELLHEFTIGTQEMQKQHQAEMLKTFNAGQGMVLVVDATQAKPIRALLEKAGETVTQLGTVTHGEGVKYLGSLS